MTASWHQCSSAFRIRGDQSWKSGQRKCPRTDCSLRSSTRRARSCLILVTNFPNIVAVANRLAVLAHCVTMQQHCCNQLRVVGLASILSVALLLGTPVAHAQGTAAAPAEASSPAAAAPGPAGSAANSSGSTGFITVQGNKFVDADCKVRLSLNHDSCTPDAQPHSAVHCACRSSSS